jgi:hypothetical protein
VTVHPTLTTTLLCRSNAELPPSANEAVSGKRLALAVEWELRGNVAFAYGDGRFNDETTDVRAANVLFTPDGI